MQVCKVIYIQPSMIGMVSQPFDVTEEELSILRKAADLYTDAQGRVAVHVDEGAVLYLHSFSVPGNPKDVFLNQTKELLDKLEKQKVCDDLVEGIKNNASNFTKEQVAEILKFITNL